MSTRDQLLREVEEFLDITGMGETYLGQKAGAGCDLVKRLRSGRDVQTATADKVFKFIRADPRVQAARRRGRPTEDSATAA